MFVIKLPKLLCLECSTWHIFFNSSKKRNFSWMSVDEFFSVFIFIFSLFLSGAAGAEKGNVRDLLELNCYYGCLCSHVYEGETVLLLILLDGEMLEVSCQGLWCWSLLPLVSITYIVETLPSPSFILLTLPPFSCIYHLYC